jgi:hypothetical protein
LAAYRPLEIHEQLDRASLSHLEVEVVTDRHFIVWGPTRPRGEPTG